MSTIFDTRQRQIQAQQLMNCPRQSISRFGLSATVGVVFTFSGAQALAHGVDVPLTTPVIVHAVQHTVQTPVMMHTNTHATATTHTNTVHTGATHSSTVSQFNNAAHSSTASANTAITNLDLSSTKTNVAANLLGHFTTLTLDVGGKLDVVSTSSKLTAAEVVGAQQILSGGSQTLLINSKGAADGGTIQLNAALLKSLDSTLGGAVSAISIPKKVTVDDSLANLTLAGQLTNSGSLVAQSTGSNAATITAARIVNSGTISSKNIDLILTAPTITNSGTIQSTGNTTLNTTIVDNTGGTISAIHAVNVGNMGNLSIAGGKIDSPTATLNAVNGALSVNETRMTGVVNDVANSAHINALGNYVMGTSNVLNDPLYSATGNFTITSAVTATNGNDLSIIAGGSIVSATNAAINTSNASGPGGNVLMVAGANFTVDPQTGNLTIKQSTLANGGSATGGSIILNGSLANTSPIASINTGSNVQADSGGNVTLVAYAGSALGTGSILLPAGSIIQTAGNNSINNSGSVNVFAGGKSGTTIFLGDVNTSGQNSASVMLSTSIPTASANGVTISGSTGSVISGSFAPSSPQAVQPASIVVGNIKNAGGAVNIESGGTTAFKTIDTSGIGGAAGTPGTNVNFGRDGGAGGDGGNGGAVNINSASSVTGVNILTYGGGGGGGGGGATSQGFPNENGGAGGQGGNAGQVNVNGNIGLVVLSGIIDASGGGGGGGGGGISDGTANGGSAGVGGSGGTANNVTLSSSNTHIFVTQGIFAVDGASGGGGTAGVSGDFAVHSNITPALSPTTTTTAAGGGGGSYGGGGGGGGGAENASGSNASGGGGGGGYFGGGGGDLGITNGVSGGFGASGGGAGLPGQGSGGAHTGSVGFQNGGGNGGGNNLSGGAIGAGGNAGSDTSGPGVSGVNVIASGGTYASGAQVTLNSDTGIGNFTAPQYVLAPNVAVAAPLGPIVITTGSDTYFTSAQAGATAIATPGNLVSFSTLGNLTTGSGINSGFITLTTLPIANASGSGGININGNINALNGVTFSASGSGNIQENGYQIISPTLTATAITGNIELGSSQGNKVNSFQFNTAGSDVSFVNAGNLTVATSSSTGANSNVNVSSKGGTITLTGLFTSAGSAQFTAETGLAVNGNVIVPGGLTLTTDTGAITSSVGITNAGPLFLNVEHGAIGNLQINAPTVSVTGNATSLNDRYTGATTILSAHGDLGYGAGDFQFYSAGSSLTVEDGAISAFTNVGLYNSATTAPILLGNNSISADKAIFLTASTAGVSTLSSSTRNTLTAPSITFSTSGNVAAAGGAPLQLSTANITITGGATNSTSLNDSANVNLNAISVKSFFLQALNIDVVGKVTAPTISLDSLNNILQTSAAGSISGNQVTLTASNTIGSSSNAAGLPVALTGTAPTLTLQAGNAAIQSTGTLSLGTSNISNNLNVTASGAITETGVVQANGQAIFSGPSVTVNGNLIANNLSVLTPASGVITVGPGGAIETLSGTLQAATINLQAGANGLSAGIIETVAGSGASTGSVTLSNPTAALNIIGGGAVGAIQSLTLNSGGNISIAPSISINAPANETITAKGSVNLPNGTISVAQDGSGNGGTIAITAASLTINNAAVTPTNLVTFNANALNGSGGNGGSISLTLTGPNSVAIGGTNGTYIFDATGGADGGNGGSVYVKSGGILNVNTSSGALNINPNANIAGVAAGGNGGNLSLVATTNLSIVGSLSTAPGNAAGANWGNITLAANGGNALPFFIEGGGTTPQKNGITGTIEGGNITITNAPGIVFNASNVVGVNAASGSSPTLTLNTNSVSGSGSINDSFGLVINSTSNLSLATLGAGGYGTPTTLAVNAKGNVTVPASLLNQNNESSISLTSTNILTLPVNTITVAPTPLTNNGGTIFISAVKQNFAAKVLGPLQLNAIGGAGGSGGTITYDLTSTSPIYIEQTGATPTVAFNVSGTTTGGGTVNVSNAGAITLGINGITNSASLNNNINLISTGGTLLVNRDAAPNLNINLGNLTLESNSAQAFSVGGKVLSNGIDLGAGNTNAVSTGTFTIGNLGGGVSVYDSLSANATTPPATGYAANIFAKADIVQGSAADVITGPSISLQSTSGSIGTATTAFVINGTNNLSAVGSSVSLMTGGQNSIVNVNDNSHNGDVLTSNSTGSQYLFAGGGALATLGNINAINLVNLTAPGVFTQAAGTSYSTKTLNFDFATMATPLYTNALNIGAPAESVNGVATVTGLGNTNPTINIIDSTINPLSIGSSGGSGVQMLAPGGTISIITGGNIIAGTIGSGTTSAAYTTLVAGANGTISQTTGANIIGTSLVSLTSASLGTATTPFSVTAGSLALSSPGLINIVDKLNAGASPISGVTVQNISSPVASLTLSANGPIVLNNITSKGNITISDTSISGAGGITTNIGTQLVSSTGVINLNSSNAGVGTGGLNLQGNVLAANVNLTAGNGIASNIVLGGSVGTGSGAVTLVALQSDIDQTGSNATIFAKSFNFNAQDVFAGLAASAGQLQTTASAITQSNVAGGNVGIYINDQNTAPVVLSGLTASGTNASGVGASIDFTTGGNLTTTGSIIAGNVANPGSVTLYSGMSMSLGGSVGIAGSSNYTIISAGHNLIGLPAPTGSNGLTLATGSQILGANIVLSNDFPVGNIGTATSSLSTSATASLTINATGSVYLANTSSAASPLTLDVVASRSFNFTNNAAGGGILDVHSVDATANGGGDISISTNGAMNIGRAGAFDLVASFGGSIVLTSTGTGAQGNVTVADSTKINSTSGMLRIASSGSLIQIGETGGAGVTLNSKTGTTIVNTGSGPAAITLGDNVSVNVKGSGDLIITSNNALTIGDGLALNSANGDIILTANNGALQIGNPSTGASGAAASITALNGNIGLYSTGSAGSITIDNDVLSASSNSSGGQIVLDTSGVLNIAGTATAGNMSSVMTANNSFRNSQGGISLAGSSVNWATNNGSGTATTSGNISIIANGGSVSDNETIVANASGTNTGAINITAASGSIRVSEDITTQSGSATNTDNITINGATVNIDPIVTLRTDSTGGSTSGNINITSTGSGGLSLGTFTNLLAGVDTGYNSGSINLATTNGALTVGIQATVQAARSTTLTSAGGDLSLGVGGNGLGVIVANNGNVSITTDATHTIEVGHDFNISAYGPVGQGNVTLTVGSPTIPTTSPVTTSGNVTVQGTQGSATMTSVGFATSGPVTLNLQGANISLANGGATASQITFDGNNVVLADPPAPIVVAPSTLNQPLTVPTISQQLQTTSLAAETIQSANRTSTGYRTDATEAVDNIDKSGQINLQTAPVHEPALSNTALQTNDLLPALSTTNGVALPTAVSLPYSNQTQIADNAASSLSNTNLANAALSRNILTGGVATLGKGRDAQRSIVRELAEGALLVAAERPTVVPTPFGHVQIANRSLALVVSNRDGMSVYNFDDTGRGSITVSVNGETITLEPGRHVTVTHKDVENFEQVNPAQYVGYRNVRSRMMNGNAKAYFSEFNHFSAIAGLQPLKDIVNSSDPVRRKIGQHMLKTSALLQMLNKDSAPFELMTASSVTAMN